MYAKVFICPMVCADSSHGSRMNISAACLGLGSEVRIIDSFEHLGKIRQIPNFALNKASERASKKALCDVRARRA